MMLEQPVLTLVIPVFNEGTSVKAALEEIVSHVEPLGLTYECIVIDDGSTDHTWEALTSLHQASSKYRCFRLSRNFGKEYALSLGLEHARGQAAVTIDADLQHPPVLIKEMVEKWQEGNVEIVEAFKNERQNLTFFRKYLSSCYHFLFGKLTGYNLRLASDFKLLDRKVLKAWAELDERNLFFRGLIQWLGFRKAAVYFDVPDRTFGRTKFSYTKLIELSVRSIISFSTIPLYLIPLIGVFFIFFGLVMAGIAFSQWLSGIAVTGFTTVILLQLITGGLVLVALGIIGVYIAKIFDEAKRRPRYLVVEQLGQ